MSDIEVIAILTSLGILTCIGVWAWMRIERSEPNQWLLRIRNGEAIQAGIGLQVWRRPGDTIARFTSTMQRVTFDTEVLTEDKQEVQIKGFLLWVVSAKDDGPFRAFSRLGIAHRAVDGNGDPEHHHALSRAQHHAFRRSVEAAVRKAAVGVTLRDALDNPEQLTVQVQKDLAETVSSWGILLEATELTDLAVTQEELFGHMQAPYIAQSREDATKIQIATDAKIAQMQMNQAQTTARQRAELARQSKQELAEIELAEAKEAAAMAQEKAAIQEQALAQELAWEEAEAEAHHQQALQGIARKQALRAAEQDAAKALQALREEQKDLEASATLQRKQTHQEAERQQLEALLTIEASKPDAIRNAEQTQHIVTSAANALQTLPIHEIKWLSGANDNGPGTLMLGLIDALQQVATSATSATSGSSGSSGTTH